MNKLMHFRDFDALQPDHKEGALLDGTLKISTAFTDEDGWWFFGHEVVIPELVAHYCGLNITFIAPEENFDGTFGKVNHGNITGPLSWLQNGNIDYLLNRLYLSQEIWYPEIVSISVPTTDYYPMVIATKKSYVTKEAKEIFNAFEWQVWFILFVSLLIVSKLIHALWRINYPNKSKSYFNLTLYLFNLLLHQSDDGKKHLPRHILSYIWSYSTIIFTTLFVTKLYEGMMFLPQEWCDSIECFASSPKPCFTGSHSPALESMRYRHPNNKAFKKLLEKTTIESRGEIGIDNLLDFLSGRTDVILDSKLLDKIFNLKDLYRPMNGDAFIMAAKYDDSLEVAIIRTGHPKKDKILRTIARCSEHGIVSKWDQLDGHLLALAMLALAYRFVSKEKIKEMEEAIGYKKTTIAVEDFHHLLIVFTLGVGIAILVAVIEMCLNRKKISSNKVNTLEKTLKDDFTLIASYILLMRIN
jgi:hypothetical protein